MTEPLWVSGATCSWELKSLDWVALLFPRFADELLFEKEFRFTPELLDLFGSRFWFVMRLARKEFVRTFFLTIWSFRICSEVTHFESSGRLKKPSVSVVIAEWNTFRFRPRTSLSLLELPVLLPTTRKFEDLDGSR